MRVYKDKQFIVFEFEDSKTVKYNLSNGETIGKNNRLVKSLNTQLRGYSIQDIINSIEDENYRNFISYVNKEVNRSRATNRGYFTHYSNKIVNKITNVGSLLSYVNNYAQYEQYFACGLTNVDLDSRSEYRLRCSINDIPKGLLKVCRQYQIHLDSTVLRAYKNIPNLYATMFGVDFNSITQKNIESLLKTYGYLYNKKANEYVSCRERANCDYYEQNLKIKFLVENYNYNLKSLLIYLDNLMTYEAINGFHNLCNDFYDYVKMASEISLKYEKYPRYFLSTHAITIRNYNRLKEAFEEEAFAKRIDTELEYKIDDYKFIYPKSTSEIKDEAAQQSHCVASYIQDVIDGKCHIMFLRKQNQNLPKEFQYNKSLITLEIKDYHVVQARGKFNRTVFDNERRLIDKFNIYLAKIKETRTDKLKESVA